MLLIKKIEIGRLFYLMNKFATFIFLSFQLKLQYYKSSETVVSENNHLLQETIVLMYSKIFLNSKKMSRQKCMR